LKAKIKREEDNGCGASLFSSFSFHPQKRLVERRRTGSSVGIYAFFFFYRKKQVAE
jgi:hypothetical protein